MAEAMDERPQPQRRQAYTDSFSRSEDPLTQLGLPPRTGKTGRLEPVAPPPPGRPLSTTGDSARRPQTARLPRTQSLQSLGTGPLSQKIDKALDKGADGLASILFGTAQAIIVPLLKVLTYPLILAQQVVMLPLQWFTAAIDAITGMMGGFAQSKPSPRPPAAGTARRAPATTLLAQPAQAAPPPPPAPALELGFVSLFQQGIRFLTVRNLPLVNPEHVHLPDAEAIVMARAILEIQGCAQLAGALPPTDKGPYAGRSIAEVMALVDRREVLAFLAYVITHPKPFLDRQLKLADAFATWIHKGAPS
jgi:hypothetical protein